MSSLAGRNPFVQSGPVPESEMRIEFARSGGPGGQNVNKTSTKAQLHWDVDASAAFSTKEKTRIKNKLANRLTNEGEIVLSSESERSQSQNKEVVIKRLQSLVRDALKPEKKRIPTKPTRASKERRLKTKRKTSQKKQLRKPPKRDE